MYSAVSPTAKPWYRFATATDCLSKRERQTPRYIDSRNIVSQPCKESRTWDNSDDDSTRRIKAEYLTGERMGTGAYSDRRTSFDRVWRKREAGIERERSFAHRLAATANGIGARSSWRSSRDHHRRSAAKIAPEKISARMLRPVPYLESFEPTRPAGRTCVARVNVERLPGHYCQ